MMRRVRAAVTVTVLAAFALVACGDDPDAPAAGSPVGVLLSEDLDDGSWTDAWWFPQDATDEGGADTPNVDYHCKVPAATTSTDASGGRVAHASAAWRSLDDSATLVWSLATRWDDSEDLERVWGQLERTVDECAEYKSDPDGGMTSEVAVSGTETAPVLDESYEDQAGRWRVRTAWTRAAGDVLVQVVVAWVADQEPAVDAADLLPVAVERASSLPETSPNPPGPPACEDC